jgi:hypothetical protein
VSATWTVRAGEDLYVRSAYGTVNASTRAAIDAAYHAKYGRCGQQIVGTVTGAHAAPVTLRLDPQDAS